MNRNEYVLAALSTANKMSFTPVQVQKLFFLLDMNVAKGVGGPYFKFVPYNYGPYDSEVYRELERLAEGGFVEIQTNGSWRTYALSVSGQATADALFKKLPGPVRDYLERVSEFVRSLSFTELVSAIYKAYPDMRKRSVFQE